MEITVYRPNQIGGCVTKIKSKNACIVIDVGFELDGVKSGEIVEVEEITKGCDAVLITHYHGDHIGEFNHVDSGTPIYMGMIAHEMFLNLQKTIKSEHVDRVEKIKTFRSRERIEIGDMVITPYRTDHSAYDAYMFLIECDGKRVLHTGDFRLHGWAGKCVEAMLDMYVGKINALICEGTMLSRSSKERLSEYELYKKAKNLMRNNKKILIHCSSTNIDSIASFYRAAMESGMWVFADNFQRKNLDIVTANAGCDLFSFPFVMKYRPNDQVHIDRMNDDKGFCMFVRHSGRAGELARTVMNMHPDRLFVYSMWDGYLKEETRNNDIYAFVPKAHKYLHTSGHAYEEDIIKLCEKTTPDIVFPIHSEDTGRMEKLEWKGKGKVRRLKSGKGVDPIKILEEEI